jgi:hypothetical protein
VKLRGLAALAPHAPRGRAGAAALAILLVSAMAEPSTARADDGSVSGEVTLAPASQRGAPPARPLGFVPRAQNPLKPAEAYDPRPYLVVVLEGGPAGAARDRVRYAIEGAAFSSPIWPVQAGVAFEIVNRSAHSPRLYAEGAAEILAGEPINPRGTRNATVSTPYRAFAIRDRESAHLEGAVVAFPHPHFSLVDGEGRFEMTGIPAGTYTARIWYRSGWLKIRPEQVTVPAGGRARVQIAIPPRLEIDVPATDGAAE